VLADLDGNMKGDAVERDRARLRESRYFRCTTKREPDQGYRPAVHTLWA